MVEEIVESPPIKIDIFAHRVYVPAPLPVVFYMHTE